MEIETKRALLLTILIILVCFFYITNRHNLSVINNDTGRYLIKKIDLGSKKYEDQALEALYNKEYEKSLELWKKALKHHPQYPEGVYHNMGMTYVFLNDYENAIKYLNKTLEVDDGLNSTRYYLGIAYYNLGRFDEAKENFLKAATMNGRNGTPGIIRDSYEHLYNIELRFGDKNLAQEYLEKSKAQ